MSGNLLEDLEDLEAFIRLRERIFSAIQTKINIHDFGLGYEGSMRVDFPSAREAKATSGRLYVVALESSVLSLGKTVWSGPTLGSVVDKINKDIDLWYEEDSTERSPGPDSEGTR